MPSEAERVTAIVGSAVMEAALQSRCVPGITGAELWSRRVEAWRERGVLERDYSRRRCVVSQRCSCHPNMRRCPNRLRSKMGDIQRAKLPPKVQTGEELVRLGESVWQDRAMLAKAVEMWDAGMSAGAVRQAQCLRIGWVKQCKAHHHLWHFMFRCGLRFCLLCMAFVYESLFY